MAFPTSRFLSLVLFFFQTTPFSDAVVDQMCTDNTCQNGGNCVKQGSFYLCICPCQYSGKHCEFANMCSDVLFSSIGCFGTRSDKLKEFQLFKDISTASDDDWNAYLIRFACECASKAKQKGYRYLSLGEEQWCSLYNQDAIFNPDDKQNDGCRGETPNRNQCNDVNNLVACVGSLERDYIYELFMVTLPHGLGGRNVVYLVVQEVKSEDGFVVIPLHSMVEEIALEIVVI